MLNKYKKEFSKKQSSLKLLLTVLFIACLMISNIIASKQIQLPFNLVMPGAVLIFPITYILSDIFSEVYGYTWSRVTNYLGIAMNLLAVIFFCLAISIPAPEFYTASDAFKTVLGSTPRILFASLLGLWVGDFLNDNVFKIMKAKHLNTHKGYGIRAILSSVVGQLGDSLIFIPIAFYGAMPLGTMLIMIFTQATFKILYEIVILPVSTFIMKKVSKYENII